MDTPPPPAKAVCSTCGEPLNADGGCLGCLLRAAMEESVIEEPHAAPPRYGDFEIMRRKDGSLWELGRGAMGVTYRAVDLVLHRAVALKVIQLGASGTLDAESTAILRERFLREARAAAALRHSHVAAVFQFGASEQADRCYYAMELVEGETLEARVRRDGPLPVSVALEIVRQVCTALVAAAGSGLVHRDLKPGNIMLTSGDGPAAGPEVKVIDFGLAKAAATSVGEVDLTHGGFVGTPAFASPEQFARQRVDARSDLYSLGVTLWYALTGRVPFQGRTVDEWRNHPGRQALPVEQLKAHGVPTSVVALLHRTLAVDPAERPASARDLLGALDACRQALDRPFTLATTRRRLMLGMIAAGCVLTAAAGWWWARTGTTDRPAAVHEGSLAVLPFQALVPEQSDPALELGMADTLIGKLSGSQVVVPSLNSVRKYASPTQNARAAGRELGVGAVLEGNVQRAGDRIRVSARLINVADGTARSIGTFDERFTDVFAVQDAISQKVADALALRLNGPAQQRLNRRETNNVEAYQLYLLGRYHFNKLIPSEIRASIGLFRQALALDEHYALAYQGLAEAYRAMTITGDQRPADFLPQAKAAATKALELDDTLAEPHATLAFIHFWYDWDWEDAEQEAKRAIELNANSGFAHFAYAHLLALEGRNEEALAEGAKAVKIDPVSLMFNALYGSFLHYAGQDEAAKAQLRKALELDQTFWIAHHFLGKILVRQGRFAEAILEQQKAEQASHGNSLTISAIGYTDALSNATVQARMQLQALEQLSSQRYVPPQTFALVHLGLGQRDQAFATLEQAFAEHDIHLSYLKADPQWDPLRNDPRFVALLRRIGLR
ncbi:MAG: protein kinase [Rhodospirillales bacterium]|nr:protein kinase [Acetobacter sp.]